MKVLPAIVGSKIAKLRPTDKAPANNFARNASARPASRDSYRPSARDRG